MQAFRLILLYLTFLSLPSCAQQGQSKDKKNNLSDQINDQNGVKQSWKTDLSQKAISLAEITVLIEKDAIPSIDKPKFVSVESARTLFYDKEPAIVIEHKGTARAYPLSILMWHEIVNDKIQDLSIIVTYCPLCNAAIVFNSALHVDGQDYLLDFGVSGMLRNSDMVMYDRLTESWWQQFMGEGLVGQFAGAKLKVLPSLLIALEDFYKQFPNGQILSRDNGVDRQYGINPYTNYDRGIEDPWAFKGEIDRRIPATERVIDFCVGDQCIVYPWLEIANKKVIHDSPFNEPIVLFYQPGAVSVMGANNIREARPIGSVTVFKPQINGLNLQFTSTEGGFKDQTESIWDITGTCIEGKNLGLKLTPVAHGNHFAFAWFAFHPNTLIYKPN